VAHTISTYKVKRGWYRLFIFDAAGGLVIYRLKGKQEVRDKLAALRKHKYIE